jgi:mRNA interferase MazF
MIAKHGYLYTADLNPRLGSEAGKIRPVVVIQTNLLNETGHPSTWILPCTTKLIGENQLRVFLPRKISGNLEDCEVMIDQSRAIDNSRFKTELGKIPTSLLKDIKLKLKVLAEIP